MSFSVEMGSKVKTKVSKFVGVVTSRSENLYGCNRYFVQPEAGKEMKVPDGYWFDEADINILSVPKKKPVAKNTGGPMSKVR